jgi:hypothetical protein
MKRVRYLSWLVLPGYVLVTVVWLWPVVAGSSSSIPLSNAHFDPFLQSFLIGWDWKALTTDPSKLFHPPIFIPEPRTLTYMDHMTGEAILAGPLLGRGWNSLAGAYNWVLLASFVLSAWATYRLTRLFGTPRVGAALSGAWFAFSSYRLAQLDLLNQLQTQFLPLGIFFLIRYMRRKKKRDAAGVVGALTAQVYFGWYYTFYLGIAVAAVGFYMAVVRGHAPPWKHGALWLGLFLVGLLVILPVTWPYIEERHALPEFGRSIGETVLYSADLTDYVRWHPHSLAATRLGAPSGGQPYWPGTPTVLLTLVWLFALFARAPEAPLISTRAWPWRSVQARLNLLGDHGAMLFLSAVGFVMSLGPVLHVGGRLLWIPLPYALAFWIFPGFSSMRAPARLSVLVVLGLVVIAGHGWGWIRKQNATLASWLAVLAIPFLFAESWIRPIPTASIPKLDRIPQVYSWLASEPAGTPFLEIPVPREDSDETAIDAYRQMFVLAHGQPRLDGSSGFTSPRYRSFRITMQDFPDGPSIDALERMGAKLVVVHLGDVPRERRDDLQRSVAMQKRLLPRARFEDVAVYELIR